ncbi:hypothetical protein I8920_03955 [Curtobacterium sp. YC1]|uniref:hypothetical protein n=1 Tax=Curtobacterium sp. YC1 TaxID=2795488 RepID=UPI0018E59831|nr:hypothetical protein [Curtobacterium sp. YC1]QQD76922.1 hypothetical protein I8920_03955 [Curtobacterium sp. YC1]
MATAQDGSEVVLRFSPFLPDRLLENAEDTFADETERKLPSPRYGVSVLAMAPEEGEDLLDTVRRIIATTSLGGKKVAVMTGNELRARGFELVADATDIEPQHHLVGGSPFTEPPEVDELASLMQDRITNPAWKDAK